MFTERTSVGLDVHARSVVAAAIDGVTGEVFEARLTPSHEVKKEMEKDEFTIKVFLKLMRLLRLKEFSMTFHGTWHDGKQLGDGKGLHYIIDLDLEDVDEIELPANLKDSFIRQLSESGELETFSALRSDDSTTVEEYFNDDYSEDEAA